jgi:cellulose synthase/poly-beta-1,6-N-acetylglucosamine synthase-like glycosyltransferase
VFQQLYRKLEKFFLPIIYLEVFLLLPFEILLFLKLSGYSIDIFVILLSIIISCFNFVFLFDTLYNLTILACGLNPNGLLRSKDNSYQVPLQSKFHKFALIICAHNEMYVIGNTLEQMVKLNYPLTDLKIIVMCDNCSDDTVKISKSIAKKYPDLMVVLERKDRVNKGKPFAVRYAIDWIESNYPEYEAISVADADNIYHKDFFQIMNMKLNNGSKIIQGYLGVKNPYDSFVSTGSTLSYYASSLVYFVSRQNLGMSSTIGGTGFVVSRDVLNEIGWDMGSLTEDLEFSTKAILLGHRVEFAYDAVTYDEKPNTLEASFNQRKRWMQGHNGLAIEYVPRLIKAFLLNNRPNPLSIFDYIIYLLRPIKKVIYGYIFLILVGSHFFNIFSSSQVNLFPKNLVLTLGLMLISMFAEYSCAVLEKYRWTKIIETIYYYTIFNLNDYCATFAGIFLASPKGIWVKTEHRAIASVEKVMSN